MASPLPTPLAAALGIVPAVLDGVRRLPGRAVQLPVLAVSNALSTMDVCRRQYDDLAERGERLVARLRGDAVGRSEELAEEVEDLGERAPFARVVPEQPEDAPADGEGARKTADTARDAASEAAQAGPKRRPAAEAPKAAPTPKAVEPDNTRVETAASPSVVQAVEQVAAATAGAADEVDHDALPLPDYDHMTLGSLRGRLRALSVEQLVQIRTYEKAHANRLPVVTMLDNRIAKLATTDAPPVNPPSQGVPTNPAQPRS